MRTAVYCAECNTVNALPAGEHEVLPTHTCGKCGTQLSGGETYVFGAKVVHTKEFSTFDQGFMEALHIAPVGLDRSEWANGPVGETHG